MLGKKILIANRGEIALRVIRTAKERGYTPVAVFSEVDRAALHVRAADEAHFIGAAAPSESYLNVEKLIAVAKNASCSFIHPGYGFLSENADFARSVEKAGLTFVGPSSKAIAAMGDKLESRARAKKAGLPLTPASDSLASVAEAKKAAEKIGYPVLIKARAGGGGKGMRRARNRNEIDEAFRLAQSEAKKAFRNDELYLEKLVQTPRHIEVQIFSDSKGKTIALGDRECSIQRRHQKIIEEAPAPHLSAKTRAAMAKAACAIARAVKYEGAGTVEFLVDAKERFYFLEMNTRLQVEHPVTEWVTGLDLVAWQLLVAEGKKLPASEVELKGHAIEVRIYAEDPDNHFFPSPGIITHLSWPTGPGVRIDSGVEAGSEISLYYDPLIAKISVWGETRGEAVARLQRTLREVRVSGIKTNIGFLQRIISHAKFVEGKLTTTFIQDEGPFPQVPPDDVTLDVILAAASQLVGSPAANSIRTEDLSAWWRSGLPKELPIR